MKRAKLPVSTYRVTTVDAAATGSDSLTIATHSVKWAVALGTLFLFAYATIDARATTPPCNNSLKSCVVERAHIAKRSAIEHEGVRDDLADSIVERASDTRYWLRCWQRGILITERITKTPPPESKRVSEITGDEDNAIKMFDMKNAACMIEKLPIDR
jgi:hypothetical protein